MLKLVKYLKTSILPILLIVLLLVVQAMCDLSLPDYTAKIVDIGIQKGGIDSLNASVAAGVLAYEIVRQRLQA